MYERWKKICAEKGTNITALCNEAKINHVIYARKSALHSYYAVKSKPPGNVRAAFVIRRQRNQEYPQACSVTSCTHFRLFQVLRACLPAVSLKSIRVSTFPS